MYELYLLFWGFELWSRCLLPNKTNTKTTSKTNVFHRLTVTFASLPEVQIYVTLVFQKQGEPNFFKLVLRPSYTAFSWFSTIISCFTRHLRFLNSVHPWPSRTSVARIFKLCTLFILLTRHLSSTSIPPKDRHGFGFSSSKSTPYSNFKVFRHWKLSNYIKLGFMGWCYCGIKIANSKNAVCHRKLHHSYLQYIHIWKAVRCSSQQV